MDGNDLPLLGDRIAWKCEKPSWSIASGDQSIIPFWYQLWVFSLFQGFCLVNSRFQWYLLIFPIRFHQLQFPSIDSLVISKVVKSRWSSPRHWFPEVKRTFRKHKTTRRSHKKMKERTKFWWVFLIFHSGALGFSLVLFLRKKRMCLW